MFMMGGALDVNRRKGRNDYEERKRLCRRREGVTGALQNLPQTLSDIPQNLPFLRMFLLSVSHIIPADKWQEDSAPLYLDWAGLV